MKRFRSKRAIQPPPPPPSPSPSLTTAAWKDTAAITKNTNTATTNQGRDVVDELKRIEAMTFCVRGGFLVKYGRRGKPHGAEFRFSLDGRAMEWENTKKKKTTKKQGEEAERNGGQGASTSKRFSGDNNTNKSVLQLHDVVKVTKGRHSAIFDRFPNLHDEKCSFFVEYVDGGGGNDVTNSRSTKNNKVRTLNVVAEDEQSRDKWVLGIETTLLLSKGLYYLDKSSGTTRLKHVAALSTRQRQSFRVNTSTSKHSEEVAVAFEERTRDHSKNLFDSKQDFIAEEGDDFGSTIKHIRQLSRLSRDKALDDFANFSSDALQPYKNGGDDDDDDEGTHQSSSIYSTENSTSLFDSSHRTTSERGRASSGQGISADLRKAAALKLSRPTDIYVWGNFRGEDDGENMNLLPSMYKGFEHVDLFKVSAGRAHFIGISKDGVLYFWGNKQRFQCGNAVTTGFHDKPNVSHPIKLSFPTDDIHGTEFSKFVDCACGDDYSLALTRDGEIKAWGTTGWVEKGSVGRGGSFGERISGVLVSLECRGARKVCKISCGPVHCAAICDYGESVYTWGEGVFYALGHGNDSRTLAKPKRVEALVGKTVTTISCGAWHTVACVAKSAGFKSRNGATADAFDGDVYVWGDGTEGQLGCSVEEAIKVPTKIHINDSASPTFKNTSNADENVVAQKFLVPVSTSIKEVACGSSYTILLSINGDVFMSGKLGRYSSKTFEIIPELARAAIGKNLVVTRIAAGPDHCLFAASSTSSKVNVEIHAKRNGKLFAIGGNKFGKIGDGTLREASVPIEIEKLRGMSIKSLACGVGVTAAIVAESARDKIEQDRKAKKVEKKLSMAMSGLSLNSFTKKNSSTTGFGGTMTNNPGDDQNAPEYAKDNGSDSKALLSLSTSLRSIASPPRVYDIERLPPPSPIPESPSSPVPVPRQTPPPRRSVIKPLTAPAAPPAAPAAPAPAPLHQQQQCEKRKKTIATNASKDNIFTAGIHPAPSMSSRERLVQLVERNVQDARFSEEDAVEKKTMKKKSSLQQQQQQRQQPVNRHGRNNSQRPLNPAFIKKANSDVDIVKTPLPLKKPLTKTTTTVPKAGKKLVKAAAVATTTTENKNKWVEEIEPGVFLTFTKLDALRTTVTRVQFARRVFENDAQGLKWWQENRARIFRDRNLAAPTK